MKFLHQCKNLYDDDVVAAELDGQRKWWREGKVSLGLRLTMYPTGILGEKAVMTPTNWR